LKIKNLPLVHITISLRGKIYINHFLRSISWFIGSDGLAMNSDSDSDPQVTGLIANDQKSEDEKWSFNLNFCAVYDFVSFFLQERALHVFGKRISISFRKYNFKFCE
jgi:hypothetical protein